MEQSTAQQSKINGRMHTDENVNRGYCLELQTQIHSLCFPKILVNDTIGSMKTDLNVKEWMSLREGLHERMQCDMRQHFAERYWLHEHPIRQSSWTESTRMKFMNMPSECSKMRSESSEYVWKTTGAFYKQLEKQNSLGELL